MKVMRMQKGIKLQIGPTPSKPNVDFKSITFPTSKQLLRFCTTLRKIIQKKKRNI